MLPPKMKWVDVNTGFGVCYASDVLRQGKFPNLRYFDVGLGMSGTNGLAVVTAHTNGSSTTEHAELALILQINADAVRGTSLTNFLAARNRRSCDHVFFNSRNGTRCVECGMKDLTAEPQGTFESDMFKLLPPNWNIEAKPIRAGEVTIQFNADSQEVTRVMAEAADRVRTAATNAAGQLASAASILGRSWNPSTGTVRTRVKEDEPAPEPQLRRRIRVKKKP